LWWALVAGLPMCWWLRRFTRTPVFSLVFSSIGALWCLTTLLRMGLLDWLDNDPGRFYFHLLPRAALFMAAGFRLERLGLSDDSRYFYPFAAAFTWAALSGVATFHEPYANWLKATAPWTRGQIEYLFIGNAAIYFALLASGLLLMIAAANYAPLRVAAARMMRRVRQAGARPFSLTVAPIHAP